MTAASIVKRKTHHWHYWMQQFPPHNSLTEDSPNQSLLTLSSLTDYQPSSSTAFLLTDYQPLLVLLSYWLIINLYLYYFPTDWLSTFIFYYFPTDYQPSSSTAFLLTDYQPLLVLLSYWLIINLYLYYFPTDWLSTFTCTTFLLTDYQPLTSATFLTDYQPLLVLLSYWLIINLYLYYFPTDWLSTFNFYYFPTDWSSAFNFYYFPQLLLLFTNWHFCFGCWIKVTSKPALLCEFYRYMSLVVHLPVFSCSSQTCDHHQCWSAQMSRIHCKTNKFFIKSHTDTDTYMHACTHTIYNEMCHGNVYTIKALPKAHCSLVNN